MEGSAQRKVPGGKLVRVRLEHDGTAITAVEISGDFFLHPEESIADLERGLVDLPIASSEAEIASIIDRVTSEQGITVIGFSHADLAAVVAGALR